MLEIASLGKTYGTGPKATHAIGDVSFTVADREFLCVVGPSGCGKTTLLKCVAGLLRPTRGEVLLHGRRVTSPPPEMAGAGGAGGWPRSPQPSRGRLGGGRRRGAASARPPASQPSILLRDEP